MNVSAPAGYAKPTGGCVSLSPRLSHALSSQSIGKATPSEGAVRVSAQRSHIQPAASLIAVRSARRNDGPYAILSQHAGRLTRVDQSRHGPCSLSTRPATHTNKAIPKDLLMPHEAVVRAKERLRGVPYPGLKSVKLNFDGSALVLSGRVRSFHLKQLAQEAVRTPDVAVVNRIEVSDSLARAG